MLKGYFKEYKKPVAEDPTIMSNQACMQNASPRRIGPSCSKKSFPPSSSSAPSTKSIGIYNAPLLRKTIS